MEGPAFQVAPAPRPNQLDPVRMQALVNAVAAQRNLAHDQVVNLQAEVVVLQQRIAMLEQANKALIGRVQAYVDAEAKKEPGAA